MNRLPRIALCAMFGTACARTVVPGDRRDGGDGGLVRGDGSLGDAIGAGFVAVHADPNTGSSIGAAFWRGGTRETYEDCRIEEIGPCVIADCDPLLRIAAPLALAGTIQAGGTSVDAIAGTYTLGDARVLWSPGDSIEIRATGGHATPGIPIVPPFAGRVVLPQPLGTTSLAASADPLSVPRDRAFALEWTATGSQVLATIRQSLPRAVSVSCVFDGPSGAGEIPVEAMAELQLSGSAGNQSTVLLTPISRRTLNSGGYVILLAASGVGAAASLIVR